MLAAAHYPVRGYGQSGRLEDGLGIDLVHGYGAGQYPRSGVGNPHDHQEPLDPAVFTQPAVKADEGNRHTLTPQLLSGIATDIDGHGIVSPGQQGSLDGSTAFQGNFPLS